MLPSEPSGRNPLANATYSDKRLANSVVQNGECSPIVCAPKYKRRKVSAVRDFPPGCGRLAQRIISRPPEEPDVAVANGCENTIGNRSTGLSEDLQEVVAATLRDEIIPVLADVDFLLPSNGSVAVPRGNGSEKRLRNYPPRRKASAVRDFPPNCGRNAPRLVAVESAKDCASPVDKSFGLGKSDSGINDKEAAIEMLGIDDRKAVNCVRDGAYERLEMSGVEVTRNAVQPKQFESRMNDQTQKVTVETDNVQDGARKRPDTNGIEVTRNAAQHKEPESGMNDKAREVTAKIIGKKTVEDAQDGDLYRSRLEKSVSKVSRDVVQPKKSAELLSSPKNKSKGKEKFRSGVGDKPSKGTLKTDPKRTTEDAQTKESEDVVASRKNKSFGQGNSKLVRDGKLATETMNVDLKQTEDPILDRDSHKSKLEDCGCNRNGNNIQPGSVKIAMEDGSGMKMDVGEDEKCSEPPFEYKLCWWDHEAETVSTKDDDDVRDSGHDLGTDKVVDSVVKSAKQKQVDPFGHCDQIEEVVVESLKLESNRVVVQDLRGSPWKQGKSASDATPPDGTGGRKENNSFDTISPVLEKRTKMTARKKVDGNASREKSLMKVFPKKTKMTARKNVGGNSSREKSIKKISPKEATRQGTGKLVIWEKDKSVQHKKQDDLVMVPASRSADVYFPPFPSGNSGGADQDNEASVSRRKVKETLWRYQALFRQLEEDDTTSKDGKTLRRIDLKAATLLKERNQLVNQDSKILGPVPGVEVGDEFQYRAELGIIGLHRQIQGGIDYMKQKGKIIATSVVASGGYSDDLDNSGALIYTGQGGNVMQSGKEPEDQKLERGNLALKNSVDEQNPVRVIHGSEPDGKSEGKGRLYVYDGLYLVEKYWQDVGPHGKLVFQFRLVRIPGQPELALKEMKKGKKNKARDGICIEDISFGKEVTPIRAVNTIDDEKPPRFKYITKMIYPDWYNPTPPEGCNCTTRCSDSTKCFCAVKNGGEIPFNNNGAIVEIKSIVYECGPSCRCPASCPNRVSQHGIKFQLEMFKTERMGWGVRSLNSIPSGSFVCEYVGELLKEKEAEERTGNDEYLFDIGNNYNDNTLWDGLSDPEACPVPSKPEPVGDNCFTIDAAEYGNIGRFINHSCTPNLYAQNVLYDNGDTRIPHIMLFAAENIPPLQELTYHYNYTLDQVRDSNGNIRKKSCFCGSRECTGRLY